MNFDEAEQTTMLRDTLRRFVEKECRGAGTHAPTRTPAIRARHSASSVNSG